MLTMILTYLYPILGILITTGLGVLGKDLKKELLPHVVAFFVSKTGLNNYDKLKKDAVDIFWILEENHRLCELADTKLTSFGNMLKAKYPLIIDERILELNKAISGEFNKDKGEIIEDLNPMVEVNAKDVAVASTEAKVIATTTYHDEQGNELILKV